MENMKWEVIVDNEWIFEGSYEQAERIAETYWSDPEFMGDLHMMTEDEFYGYK